MSDARDGGNEDFLSKVVQLHEAIIKSDHHTESSSIEPPLAVGDSRVATELASTERCLRALEKIRRLELLGSEDSQSLDLPETIGRFRIKRLLGQGTYGLVYLADDPQLGRTVAVKVPRPEVLISSALRERFVREATLAAGLEHPNIVRVYEAGQSNGLYYIVVAYCDSMTLAQWHQDQTDPISPADAARLLARLADAVHYAHTRGVIHRDLKPANVLLDRSDLSLDEDDLTISQISAAMLPDIARISDFGLAKIEGDDSKLTRTNAILGTPAYMSPEQASGRSGTVGTLTDVFSLGVMLYELVCRKPPFQETSVIATLESVRNCSPIPMRRLRADVPPDLEAICLKCLEKHESRRYASADALAQDLNRFLEGRPVSARKTAAVIHAWRWSQRNPLPAVLAASLAVCVLAVAAGATIVASRLRTQRDLAQANLDRAIEAESKLKATITDLERKLTDLSLEEMVDVQTKVIEANPNAFDAYYERGENHWAAGNYDQAIADFDSVIRIAPNHPWARADKAWILVVGPPQYRDVDAALKLCEGVVDKAPDNWSIRFTVGVVLYRAGRFSEALPHFQRGVELHHDGGNALHLYFFAMNCHALGDSTKAMELWNVAESRALNSAWEFPDRELIPVREECRKILFP